MISRYNFFICLAVVGLLSCKKSSENSEGAEFEWLKEQTLQSLVYVEGGTFRMGDEGVPDESGELQYLSPDSDDKVVRNVTLSSYSIQKYETTVKEFDAFTQLKYDMIVKPRLRNHPSYQADRPAKGMTWFLAREYCQWLGEVMNLPMDLPTEAQWEFAARSRGLRVPYATDNGQYDRGRNVWDAAAIERQTLPPGTWPPNPLGLYDMTGNVAEWTLEWYINSYPFDDEINPTGPSESMAKEYRLRHKVTRGSGLGGEDSILYRRTDVKPDNDGSGTGIRCVANVEHPINKK